MDVKPFALITLYLLFYSILGAKLPSDYKRCKLNDVSINICLKSALEDVLPKLKYGIPKLNVPPLQPIKLPRVTTREYLGVVNITQRYRNFIINGLADAKIKEVETTFSPTDWKANLIVFQPECSFKANYTFTGRLFQYPITGNGWCTITLKNIKEYVQFLAETFEKNGETYMIVKEFKVKLDPERVDYYFVNLFNGNELLENEMNNFINDNWKPLFERVRPSYEDMLGIVYRDYANKIFAQVPIKNLFRN